MPDTIHFRDAPDWGAAFAALPAEDAPADAWTRVAARLDAQRTRSHRPLWFALAAALVLALAWPWHLQREATSRLGAPATVATTSATTKTPAVSPPRAVIRTTATASRTTLARLYTESARLEALVAYARDDQMATGAAASLAARYDRHIADIDAALAQPNLPTGRQQALWQARVDTLRALAAFETNRRWLATQGERYDGALVRVD